MRASCKTLPHVYNGSVWMRSNDGVLLLLAVLRPVACWDGQRLDLGVALTSVIQRMSFCCCKRTRRCSVGLLKIQYGMYAESVFGENSPGRIDGPH